MNANHLKCLAIVAMTIDHLAWLCFPSFNASWLAVVMHVVGRLTCPIMCFFIAEGFYHTRNRWRYLTRLLVFALIAHVPYIIMIHQTLQPLAFVPLATGSWLNQTSVLWSLAAGLGMLWLARSAQLPWWWRGLGMALLFVISLPADWGGLAPLMVLFFGLNHGNFKMQAFWVAYLIIAWEMMEIFIFGWAFAALQLSLLLALPILKFYNGRKSASPVVNRIWQLVFYWYYPLHMLVLGMLFLFG